MQPYFNRYTEDAVVATFRLQRSRDPSEFPAWLTRGLGHNLGDVIPPSFECLPAFR